MNQTYSGYLTLLRKALTGGKWSEYGKVAEYPLVVFETPKQKTTVVISSGFHGDEPVGPLTFLKHGPALLYLAKARRVSLRIYPCTNPSGWATGHRYSITKKRPSNALIEYLTESGEWRGSLDQDEKFSEWRLRKEMPAETLAFANHVTNRSTPTAYLDIHQDGEVKTAGFYAYAFDTKPYIPLVRACKKFAPVLAHQEVDKSPRDEETKFKTDKNGLVSFHDGSSEDLFHRLGTKHSVALETSLKLPITNAMGVNLVWSLGIIAIASLDYKSES